MGLDEAQFLRRSAGLLACRPAVADCCDFLMWGWDEKKQTGISYKFHTRCCGVVGRTSAVVVGPGEERISSAEGHVKGLFSRH